MQSYKFYQLQSNNRPYAKRLVGGGGGGQQYQETENIHS